MNIGIISGYEINELNINSEKLVIETEYGNTPIVIGKIDKNRIFLINRHGINQNIPPHKINYRANIKALESCNVKNIISIGTVGSMKKTIKTGDLLIPTDFIDFTKSRCNTYFDCKRFHVDMNDPLCVSLRKLLIKSCNKNSDVKIHESGVYLTTEGPRLETASEIKLFSNYADVVGMTLAQEIIFAREIGICFASLCVVCNMGSGLQKDLISNEMSKTFNEKKELVYKIIKNALENIKNKERCKCAKKYLMAEV
jgi:5'-methylthioadenosine phosphorylase